MIDVEIILAILFVVILGIVLIINRKKLEVQKVLFPIIYIIMYRTKLGLKLMDTIANKYRSLAQFFGFISVGIGFVGMAFISVSIVMVIIKLIFTPHAASSDMVLVLPFTNIPGIGYLPFTSWLIAIFILAVAHEFSHGVVARAHNVEVKSSGFAVLGILAPIIPAAFVEPNEEKLKKEKDIVQYSIFAAGPVSNIFLALIFFLFMIALFNPIEARLTEPIGFSFDVTNTSLPAGVAGLTSGVVVNSFNYKNSNDSSYFLQQMQYCVKPEQQVTFGTANATYAATTIASPNDATRGFVGVNNIKNEVRVKPQYEKSVLVKVFFWFKDLFKWLFLLNLFIGLANLMPLGIVDGGRMLQLLLTSTMKDKKKAMKWWGFIGLMFLVFILFGLITNYVGNPFKYVFG
ncbi:site-2 protease family protein [Candidatus Woesearchaeota archaeon]|nr:site-2 protease family protein [Candidatus Woesearchaeota archaeon]